MMNTATEPIDVYEVDGASVLNDWGKPNDKGQNYD